MNEMKKTYNRFGLTMTACFAGLAVLVYLRHHTFSRPLSALAAGFLVLAVGAPFVLKPVYTLWMKLGLVLGWLNTRILLGLVFFLIFTPVGLLLRIFGRDLLDRSWDKYAPTYWKTKEQKSVSFESYERQS